MELYETMYGLYDHTKDQNRPMSTVAFHSGEDINKDSLLEQSMQVYVRKGIKDLFGISYLEFIGLPHDVVEMMVSMATDEMIEKNKTISRIEKELE